MLEGILISTAVAYLFYDSLWGLLCGFLVVPVCVRQKRREQMQKRQFQMEQQFQDGLYGASAALEAGYSMERAWMQAERELEKLYGKDGIFVKELHGMNQKVALNETLEQQMFRFAQKSEIESVRDFAEIFQYAKRSGGNLTEIMKRTSAKIRQNVQVQEEIEMHLAARKLEQKIMQMMPLGILCYMRLTSGGYLMPLYHTFSGIGIMTICLSVYAGACLWAQKLMHIII